MNRPMVSVVIPCFNAERWIGDTIESVYRQTWREIELVIVNDGSTDRSLAEIERQKSPVLTIVNQKNCGQSTAFNVALKRCSGVFVQYLDADDLLAPSKIERQVQALSDTVDAIATASWRVISGTVARPLEDIPRDTNDPQSTAPADWLVADWHDGGGMMFPAMWLAPKGLVDRVGDWAPELTLFNDTEYFTRLVLASSGVISCPDALCYYRKGHQQTVSGLKTPAAWNSGFHSIDRATTMLLAAETSDRTRRVASFVWQRFANICFPYDHDMGNEAERRAQALHHERLPLPGGPIYNLIASAVGWKLARSLQVWLGRR